MTRKRTSDNELVANAGAAAASRRKPSGARARVKHTAAPVEAPLTPAAEPVPQEVSPVSVSELSYEAVAALAYQYWEARGCQGGSPEEDWLRAEAELRSRTQVAIA